MWKTLNHKEHEGHKEDESVAQGAVERSETHRFRPRSDGFREHQGSESFDTTKANPGLFGHDSDPGTVTSK